MKENEQGFELNERKCCYLHNHPADLSLQKKKLTKDAEDYILEQTKQKNLTTKALQEKLNARFDKEFTGQKTNDVFQ